MLTIYACFVIFIKTKKLAKNALLHSSKNQPLVNTYLPQKPIDIKLKYHLNKKTYP